MRSPADGGLSGDSLRDAVRLALRHNIKDLAETLLGPRNRKLSASVADCVVECLALQRLRFGHGK